DPECTGALDNDEDSFATGIPGDNTDACKQDCFFDGNSGAGDDGCNWDLRCDSASPGEHTPKACPYDPNFKNCPETQSQKCLDSCGTFTPNGCDCFGCCTVFVEGVGHDVLLLPTCQAENIDDEQACPRCTKVAACDNPCGECEYCLGKAPDPSCEPPGTGGAGGAGGGGGGAAGSGAAGGPGTGGSAGSGQCPDGVTPCTPGDSSGCASDEYCLTGCCSKIIVR
ncbi:MAG TPA: hypothetical protein VKZ49_17115, partial [Polyangiaceae bacterium]|nr:hypothetical protein [Polyangiaceae bacterium]